MSYTKGKWKIFYDGEIHTDNRKICSGLGFETFKEFIDNKENQANARLIAAAPALLAACENLVRGQLQHPSFESYVNHAVWVAEQAIAEAKEQQ